MSEYDHLEDAHQSETEYAISHTRYPIPDPRYPVNYNIRGNLSQTVKLQHYREPEPNSKTTTLAGTWAKQ